VHAIRALLERNERAALCAALADPDAISQMDNPTTRQRVLVTPRQALGLLMHAYAEVFTHTTDRMEALAYEEYFCLAALARARCTAELGELRLVADELVTQRPCCPGGTAGCRQNTADRLCGAGGGPGSDECR
jgi:hypothetical protein